MIFYTHFEGHHSKYSDRGLLGTYFCRIGLWLSNDVCLNQVGPLVLKYRTTEVGRKTDFVAIFRKILKRWATIEILVTAQKVTSMTPPNPP